MAEQTPSNSPSGDVPNDPIKDAKADLFVWALMLFRRLPRYAQAMTIASGFGFYYGFDYLLQRNSAAATHMEKIEARQTEQLSNLATSHKEQITKVETEQTKQLERALQSLDKASDSTSKLADSVFRLAERVGESNRLSNRGQ